MDFNITHPDILRAEKFGSLYSGADEVSRCICCGDEVNSNTAEVDAFGNTFCSRSCRERRYDI